MSVKALCCRYGAIALLGGPAYQGDPASGLTGP